MNLQSSTLQISILQSGNPHFWDLAVMRSYSHEILQSRSKILVPLERSCCHVTVQTLQSSPSQSCSPSSGLAIDLQSQILQSSILQSGNLPFWDLAVMRSCSHKCLQSRSKFPTCEILQSWHSQDLAVIPQPVLQSSKMRLQVSCSPKSCSQESCSHKSCSQETHTFGILQS